MKQLVATTKVQIAHYLSKRTLFSHCPMSGCLIVEIHDHRKTKQQDEPVIKRVAMRPTAESLWTDILLLNEDWGFPWTEDIALEVESKVLVNVYIKKDRDIFLTHLYV